MIKKYIPRPPGCKCGPAECDTKGRVLKVRTCPVCMDVLLDSMRGVEYAVAYERSGDTEGVLLKQLELF